MTISLLEHPLGAQPGQPFEVQVDVPETGNQPLEAEMPIRLCDDYA